MGRIFAAILFALTLATSVHAKIGETRIDAETRWGKPSFEKGPVSYYHTESWTILQAYGDQGDAVICGYYKSGITGTDARNFDLLNFPDVKVWKQLPNSAGNSTQQWISEDGQSCILVSWFLKRELSSTAECTLRKKVLKSHTPKAWKKSPGLTSKNKQPTSVLSPKYEVLVTSKWAGTR